MLKRLETLAPAQRKILLLAIIYLGYISLGLPDKILDVSWLPMREQFQTPLRWGGVLLTVCGFCSSISSSVSGWVLRKIGTGRLLAVCGCVTGLSLLGYGLSPAFLVLLILAVPLGFGQGAIDTGMNFYVSKHYTSRDMSWLHCCWGVGATIGPLIASVCIQNSGSWRIGYMVIGGCQFVLAALFCSTIRIWDQARRDEAEENANAAAVSSMETISGKTQFSLKFWLCVLVFFFYCGIETTAGLWGCALLTLSRGMDPHTAQYLVTAYWGSLTAGRFLLGFAANRLGNKRMIRYASFGVLLGAGLLAIPVGGVLPAAALLFLGFALASIYPCMMHETTRRGFNDATAATLMGFQGSAAMIGTMTVPMLVGILGDRISMEIMPGFAVVQAVFIVGALFVIDGVRLRKS